MSIQNVNATSRVSHPSLDGAKADVKTIRTSELPYHDPASNITIRTTSDGGLSAEPNGRVTRAGDDSWNVVVNGMQFVVSDAGSAAEAPPPSVPGTTIPASPSPAAVPTGTTSTTTTTTTTVPVSAPAPSVSAGTGAANPPDQEVAASPRDTLPPNVAV
jgi:hypothetical protein